jgi:hypothetical protein
MRRALGNVGTLVCFGIDRSDAEIQAKRIFLPHGEQIKDQAKRDSQYHFTNRFMKTLRATFRH